MNCNSCILNVLFLLKCLPNFDFKRNKFQSILFIIDIIQQVFLNYYSLGTQMVQINTLQIYAFLFALALKFEQSQNCFGFLGYCGKKKKCAQVKQRLFLQLPSGPEINATLLDVATTLPPRFVSCWAPTWQKWFYPRPGSSQEAEYTMYNYIIYIHNTSK